MIKWKVQPKPTGPYRSFEKRGWPDADYKGTDQPAARIVCIDPYSRRRAKEQNHASLEVWIACHVTYPRVTFNWKRLKLRANNLEEAKKLATDFINQHPEYRPHAK